LLKAAGEGTAVAFRTGSARWVLSILLAAVAFAFITGCVSYDTRGLPRERDLPIDLKDLVIVHYRARVFQIGDPDLDSGTLAGYVIDPPSTSRFTRQRELHVYVDHSHPLELSPGSAISIPVETIRRVEVYEVALKRTLWYTSILSSLIAVSGLYALSVLFTVLMFY